MWRKREHRASELEHPKRPAHLVGRDFDAALGRGERHVAGALLDDPRVHAAVGEFRHELPSDLLSASLATVLAGRKEGVFDRC